MEENNKIIMLLEENHVSASFSQESNDAVVRHMKQLLMSSYSEKTVDDKFACSRNRLYYNRGKPNAP